MIRLHLISADQQSSFIQTIEIIVCREIQEFNVKWMRWREIPSVVRYCLVHLLLFSCVRMKSSSWWSDKYWWMKSSLEIKRAARFDKCKKSILVISLYCLLSMKNEIWNANTRSDSWMDTGQPKSLSSFSRSAILILFFWPDSKPYYNEQRNQSMVMLIYS